MTLSLFGQAKQGQAWRAELYPGAVVLHGFAVPDEKAIVSSPAGVPPPGPSLNGVDLAAAGVRRINAGFSFPAGAWYGFDAADLSVGDDGHLPAAKG
jgi:hypothetical protein